MRVGYMCEPEGEPYESLSILDLNSDVYIAHCSGVYEPAEDTWLTLGVVQELLKELKPSHCVDVGTGTGVLTALCGRYVGSVVATDINPCATVCAYANLSRLHIHQAHVAHCDLASCLRCPRRGPLLFVFNTPYFPPDDEELGGIVEAAWSGGLEPAQRLIEDVSDCLVTRGGCILLTTLAQWVEALSRIAEAAGLEARVAARRRYFFEDIVVVRACTPSV